MISIIIPVYNNEEHLHVCLNSVLKQTFSNFELICIDDCSTDSSLEILEYYNCKDSRMKILKNNENKGLGYSKNQGLNIAAGKYVFFLNPIDWIDSNALELLYSKSEELELDVLIYESIDYSKNNFVCNMDKHYVENKIFNPSESKSLLLDIMSSWNKFYNKLFIDSYNIRFTNENLIRGDECFWLDILLNAQRVSFLNNCLSNHRVNNDSIKYLSGKEILDNVRIADIMINSCLMNMNVYEAHKNEILTYIFNNILNDCHERIDEEYKSIFFESIQDFFGKCFYEYDLKEDILENVNKEILLKFEIFKNSFHDYYSKLKKYLAIDVGGTAIKYTLINATGEDIRINEIDSKNEKEDFFNSLDKIIQPYLNEISGIAISFPGVINVEDGIAHSGGNYSWIQDFPLKSFLEKKYYKKVWIENDGKCMVLAEFWKGNLSDVGNGVVMGLGTGIAGGIIIDGELYRGINGSAGEFSSILESFKNPINAKKLSQIGGYKSLVNNYAKAKGIDSKDITGRIFFENYYAGDEIAINVLKDYAKIISTGIINIHVILDVEKFCIGGGISAQDVLINEIKEIVHDYFMNNLHNAFREPKIEKCYFENAAGCVGALYNFLKMEKII